MRNLSLIIIALTIILIFISSRVPKGDRITLSQPVSPHGAGFKVSCNKCHSAKSWEVDKDILSFDHNLTEMPLIGQHTKTECKLCHPTLVFSEAKKECAECHNDVHESTVGKDCSHCHTPHSWLVNNITQIHQQSRFPLIGVHSSVDCYQCHKSETFHRFEVLGTECFDCHSEEYAATTQPNHVINGYSTQCLDCHSIFSKDWNKAGLTGTDHSFFPLTQGHASVNCNQCHTSGTPSKISPECISCHQSDYNASTNPNHVVSNYSTNCIVCHSTMPGWKPAIFNHSLFPLTQAHDIDDCTKCHINGNYMNTRSDCFSCHQSDYNASTNPNHVVSNYSTNCTVCHSTMPGWKPAIFNHSLFPLTQAHDIDDCTKCHINGNYTNTRSECISCHQADYTGTTNPGHAALGFSQNCAECHTINPGWKPAAFNHSNFPLSQGHDIDDCTKCHINGNYTNTRSDCFSCHQPDYTGTTNPGHAALGFSQNCTECHTTNPGWRPATFNHSNFPLTQGHNIGDCTKCHINGNYTNTPSNCISCHRTDYNNSTNPGHMALGLSENCAECHTTNPGWRPASFSQHDAVSFPIYSGKHQGDWNSCTDCHSNTANYKAFSCLNCHKHNQTDMDNKHRGRSGYSYNSAACLSCHPRGN